MVLLEFLLYSWSPCASRVAGGRACKFPRWTRTNWHMFPPNWATRDFCVFTWPALASRPTRLCPFGILLVNLPFHPILKALCNQKSTQRGLLILLALLRRSVCFLEPGVCLCTFRPGLGIFGFDVNLISRIDILILHWRCPQIKPLV